MLPILVLAFASADLYMHWPRGCNNRLNEQSAERNNANRLFDSQNNNRGGYNVGDKANLPHSQQQPYSPPATTFDYSTPPAGGYTPTQYQFVFFEGSELSVQWYNQHGCGGNESTDPYKLHCQIIWQYVCETVPGGPAEPALDMKVSQMMDGGNTNTPNAPDSFADIATTITDNNNNLFGRHESEWYYYMCTVRQRNYHLFHADQGLGGSTTIFTRQNNNGNQHGLECVEERDYYPWWNPTPWIDVAYLTSTIEYCPLILSQSQNNNPVCYCDNLLSNPTTSPGNPIPIDPVSCANRQGNWTCWSKNLAAPYCGQVPWSRQNHLGSGRNGQFSSYNWTLPAYSELVNYGFLPYSFTSTGGQTMNMMKCVGRLRYNMTTGDYDPFNTTSANDDNEWTGVVSPVQQNPTVDIGSHDLVGLKLALNTNQYGRTFQDRTHIFYIAQRPSNFGSGPILNLGVRGKRGDVVQTYPAVQYDFAPNRVAITADTLLHVQWTGSNTHNNGNPGGDGQTGDEGLGNDGTDRHNFVQIQTLADNYPLPLDKYGSSSTSIWNGLTCYNYDGTVFASWVDCALTLATSGQLRSTGDVAATTADMDPLLNDAPASLVGGVVLSFPPSASGNSYAYMSTRNTWFSHRSEKGLLTIL